MILVADSGSTKCDWILIDGDQRYTTATIGFNPVFHDADFIASKIKENLVLSQFKDQVEQVFFYGAGCSCIERNSIVEKALSLQFTNLENVVVEEDIAAAAYATCENKAGIVCILGTGSNSCYFDGEHIQMGQPALGYILGDEGSGAYFGKKIVSHYMYNQLPDKLVKALKAYGGEPLDDLIVSVYNKPNANVFLASFMKFIHNQREHPFIQKLVYDGMKEFAQIHILHYKNYNSVPVNFVGSVAYYFKDVLHAVAKDLGFEINKILQKPIYALSDYHMNIATNQIQER